MQFFATFASVKKFIIASFKKIYSSTSTRYSLRLFSLHSLVRNCGPVLVGSKNYLVLTIMLFNVNVSWKLCRSHFFLLFFSPGVVVSHYWFCLSDLACETFCVAIGMKAVKFLISLSCLCCELVSVL